MILTDFDQTQTGLAHFTHTSFQAWVRPFQVLKLDQFSKALYEPLTTINTNFTLASSLHTYKLPNSKTWPDFKALYEPWTFINTNFTLACSLHTYKLSQKDSTPLPLIQLSWLAGCNQSIIDSPSEMWQATQPTVPWTTNWPNKKLSVQK